MSQAHFARVDTHYCWQDDHIVSVEILLNEYTLIRKRIEYSFGIWEYRELRMKIYFRGKRLAKLGFLIYESMNMRKKSEENLYVIPKVFTKYQEE